MDCLKRVYHLLDFFFFWKKTSIYWFKEFKPFLKNDRSNISRLWLVSKSNFYNLQSPDFRILSFP